MKKQTKEKQKAKKERIEKGKALEKRVKWAENKKQKKKEKIMKKRYDKDYGKLNITEKKVKSLLDIGHLEELFYLLHILKNEDIELFIKHYRESKIESKDEKIDKIMKDCKNSYDLLELLKKELIEELHYEYENLMREISDDRKKGLDVYIEDINLMSIPLKIKMFGATAEKQDYYKAKKMISNIKESLKVKREEWEKEK